MSDKAIMDRWDDPNAPDAAERRLIYAIASAARINEFKPNLFYDSVTRLVLEYDRFRHDQIKQLIDTAIERANVTPAPPFILAKNSEELAGMIKNSRLDTEPPKVKRLFAVTGWDYKWIFELERGPFRFIIRRELKRWL